MVTVRVVPVHLCLPGVGMWSCRVALPRAPVLGMVPTSSGDGRPPVLGSVADGGCPSATCGSSAHSRLTVGSDCCRAPRPLYAWSSLGDHRPPLRGLTMWRPPLTHPFIPVHGVRARGCLDFTPPQHETLKQHLEKETCTVKNNLKRKKTQSPVLPCVFAGNRFQKEGKRKERKREREKERKREREREKERKREREKERKRE